MSQFVFQPDEVVKNSFEIFVKTPDYVKGIEELEKIFGNLRNVFLENEGLDAVIASFTELRDAFTITKSGGIAKTSKVELPRLIGQGAYAAMRAALRS